MDADQKELMQSKLAEFLILNIAYMVEDVMGMDMGEPGVRGAIHEVLVELANTMPETFDPKAEVIAEIEASRAPKN